MKDEKWSDRISANFGFTADLYCLIIIFRFVIFIPKTFIISIFILGKFKSKYDWAKLHLNT